MHEQPDRPTPPKRPWWAPKWGRRSSGLLGLFHLLVASVLATAWVEGGRTDTLLLVVVVLLGLQAAYDLAIWAWLRRVRRSAARGAAVAADADQAPRAHA